MVENFFFFSKINVISLGHQGPHSEPQRVTLCSALFQSTRVTLQHLFPARPSLLSLIIPRTGIFLVRFPARADFLFSEPSILPPGPNHPVQWVLLTFSTLVKRPGREGKHSRSSGAKCKNERSCASTSLPVWLLWGVSECQMGYRDWRLCGLPRYLYVALVQRFETEQKQTINLQTDFYILKSCIK